MYFVNGLIKDCAFLIDRDFNKVEVIIARLVVRARINENLSSFIDGNRRRRLTSVFVKRAVLIPEWLVLRISGLTQQFELVAVALEVLSFAVLHKDLICLDLDCRVHVKLRNLTDDEVAVGHDATTVGV